MAQFKKKMKKIGRYVWELFKSSLPSLLMYCCAGAVLMMLTMKGEKIVWTSSKIAWAVVCIAAAATYNALLAWMNGGSQYEMLVSGNIKRSRVDNGSGFKMSAHKEMKEYRAWKGFLLGAITGIWALICGIVLGCNQAAIDGGIKRGALGWFVIISFFISGWSVLPFYCMNAIGVRVSYFLSCLFALIPVLVTGCFYIAGAYARRNKTLRQQEIAARAAEQIVTKEKKINYGGLPGTKPKKRK